MIEIASQKIPQIKVAQVVLPYDPNTSKTPVTNTANGQNSTPVIIIGAAVLVAVCLLIIAFKRKRRRRRIR